MTMTAANINSILPPVFFEVFVGVLFAAMILGLAYDALAGRKLAYFRAERRMVVAASGGVGRGVNVVGVVGRTLVANLATSRELAKCGASRRASHELMLWGFILSVLVVVVKAYAYPKANLADPTSVLGVLLNLGGLLVLVGGIWYLWLRVNVSSEANSVSRFVRADIFVLSLLANAVLGFVLEGVNLSGSIVATEVVLGIYLPVTAFMFFSVPWTKFSHIFYKGAYAIQRELDRERGVSRLPTPSENSYIKE
ncbi:MAG: hypothetical protein QW688_03680 [Thermoprotei archaeon]